MAQHGFFQEHWLDEHGRPAGGVSSGTGFVCSWQNGPLGPQGTPERRPPNGCFVEDILHAVIGRIEFYQASPFACIENERALVLLKDAATWLDARTKDREARHVEGTHAV